MGETPAARNSCESLNWLSLVLQLIANFVELEQKKPRHAIMSGAFWLEQRRLHWIFG